MYVQGPPTPIPLRDELHIELSSMHYYGLISTLLQLNHSSTMFAHRKELGKLRFLIDIRRVNRLLKNDYFNTKVPVSNMTDATIYFAGKSVLKKFDCSLIATNLHEIIYTHFIDDIGCAAKKL